MVVVVHIDLACSTVILMLYASHSCRQLHVGMLFAGDLQGFVVTNCKLCAHEIAFWSFMLPNHGTHMSFAAREHKSHMLFAPLEWLCSDKVVCSGIA